MSTVPGDHAVNAWRGLEHCALDSTSGLGVGMLIVGRVRHRLVTAAWLVQIGETRAATRQVWRRIDRLTAQAGMPLAVES